jgi:hypothetical protein
VANTFIPRDQLQESLGALIDAHKAREQEVDAMRKDAERYRWLRKHGDELCTEKDGYGGSQLKTGDMLDSAIDAAMQQDAK